MPPARKDSTEADDPSRPSTSRAFSPVIVPPVKRARISTGGAPPATSRRQSTGAGTKQARLEAFVDEKALQEGLLVAAAQMADEIMKEEEEEGKEKIEIDNEVISATARIVWDALAEDWATDLLAFSRHANRETIKEEDVKLLMRRNPNLLAEILAECEGEEEGEAGTSNTMGSIKRRSTGGSVFNRCGETIEETEMFDTITTPLGASSMTSVVPETPEGIVPLAHSTPLSGHRNVFRAAPSFSIPSPIREEAEEESEKRDGRRTNRSIMNDLSATMRGRGGEMEEEPHSPTVIDLRHPREREDEERRMRMGDGDPVVSPLNQQHGTIKKRHAYGRADSPELFGHSDDLGGKKDEYDSFDDDYVVIAEGNEGVGRAGDASHRMSESAALREMLDEDEEGQKVVAKDDEHDSFNDDSIQFVEVKNVTTPSPKGDIPSTSAAVTSVQQLSRDTAAAVAARAAPAKSAASLRSSQDSFYHDEILTDPPQPVHVPPVIPPSPKYSTGAVVVQQPPAAPAQPVRPNDYDSFDDDDDFVTSPPSRSKENNLSTTRSGGPSPASSSTTNRWSTVTVEEIVSPPAAVPKNRGGNRGGYDPDFFQMNIHAAAPTKPSPINRSSPTVPTRPSPTVPSRLTPSVPLKPSPPVSTRPTHTAKKQSPAASSTDQRFSFYVDSPAAKQNSPVLVKTPVVQRGDSDFLNTSSRPTTSTMRTPRGRGGTRGGRGFPRRVDPNSKVNRMIREQSTPVRLSPRPPSRINEVVGSFDDDDFDVSAFDD